MSVKELTAIGVFVGTIISGWVWLDSRHEPAGVSEQNRLRGEIYALDLTIADLTSTIGRYNNSEEAGTLSEGDRVRRAELLDLRNHYSQERRFRQERLSAN